MLAYFGAGPGNVHGNGFPWWLVVVIFVVIGVLVLARLVARSRRR
jgi:hypothetical protein